MAKKGHGHHGGAWKVAYADFVTAMMALFLVLWLVSQDQKIKEAVERSFRNPFASVTKESTGIIPAPKETMTVMARNGNFDSASAVELNMLRKLAQDLTAMLQTNPEAAEEKTVDLEMTPEGMRISVFDRNNKPIFEPNSSQFTSYGTWVFTTLAWQISRFTNNFNVELEGHTLRGAVYPDPAFGPWELSTARANAARRKLLEHDVQPSQVLKVAGFADTQPLPNLDVTSESNRRVGVLLKLKSSHNL
ncbi:MAG: flagellar motor protein MotB [Verrucomicrobiota bacterium]